MGFYFQKITHVLESFSLFDNGILHGCKSTVKATAEQKIGTEKNTTVLETLPMIYSTNGYGVQHLDAENQKMVNKIYQQKRYLKSNSLRVKTKIK